MEIAIVERGELSVQRKRVLFFLLAVFCVAIPGFAAIKAFLIVAAWGFVGLTSRFALRTALWYLSVLMSLALCGEVALTRGVSVPDFANHLTRFFLFFLVLGLGASMASAGAFDRRTTDRLILTIAVLSVMLKVAILATVISGAASFESVQSALGFESVTDSIGFGIQRLQFPSDIILVFLLACYSGRRRMTDVLFLVSVTVSVFLSFSRYLFVAYALCLMIRLFRMRKADVISGAAIVLSVVAITLFSASLSSRFEGEGTRVSDDIRAEQMRYLDAAIIEHPLVGAGIGSSVNGYRRSETIPFSYEVQWYAMAMQLGIVGLLWFVVNVMTPLVEIMRARGRYIFPIATLAVWALGGLTNPFILSLGSAFGLCLLMFTMTCDDPVEEVRLTLEAAQVQG